MLQKVVDGKQEEKVKVVVELVSSQKSTLFSGPIPIFFFSRCIGSSNK